MTYKEKIKGILETFFSGYKEEILNDACHRIVNERPYGVSISRQQVFETIGTFAKDLGATKFWLLHDSIKELPAFNSLDDKYKGLSEQTLKDIDRAFRALEDIKVVSEALLSITQRECCDYGFTEACEIAEKYAESEE